MGEASMAGMGETHAHAVKTMSTAVAIFAKTPGLTPAKTRLAASIGTAHAEAFYGHCLAVVEEAVMQAINACMGALVPYWAVAEEAGVHHPRWQHFTPLWTGEGELGTRLDHVYVTLRQRHETVLLIGTDAPQLGPQHMAQAMKHLAQHAGFVMGRAHDGGFYLFGGNQPIPRAVWEQTPYSVATTATALAEKLAPLGAIHALETLGDVDVIEDLQALWDARASMRRPRQQRLIAAMEPWLAG